MFSEQMSAILLRVLSSWQVLGATLALIAYMIFVANVARGYRRPGPKSKRRRRARPKKAAVTMAKSAPEEAADRPSSKQALGIEED